MDCAINMHARLKLLPALLPFLVWSSAYPQLVLNVTVVFFCCSVISTIQELHA